MKEQETRNEALYRFFTKWLTNAFTDIQLFDRSIVLYIADILSRFARSENLHDIRRLPHSKLETVVNMLLEAEVRNNPSEPEFDPFTERDIRKHIADYTLFMTGIFREYIQNIGILDMYLFKGSESYRKVYEFDSALAQRQAPIFSLLHKKFDEYSGGINYMKKVYFDYKMPTNFPQEIIRSFYVN